MKETERLVYVTAIPPLPPAVTVGPLTITDEASLLSVMFGPAFSARNTVCEVLLVFNRERTVSPVSLSVDDTTGTTSVLNTVYLLDVGSRSREQRTSPL